MSQIVRLTPERPMIRLTLAQELRVNAIIYLLGQAWGVTATISAADDIIDHIKAKG